MRKNQIIIISFSLLLGLALIFGAVLLKKDGAQDVASDSVKIISSDELAQADGKDDKNCYVAIEGTVYEISQGNKWRDGEHITSEGQAYCGRDLTEVIGKSPHGKSILSLLTEVGKLQ